MNPSWVEVSLPRLAQNLHSIRAQIPRSTRIIAVVKANAYGHGVRQVSSALHDLGIRDFAVATLAEAVELRQVVPESKILVLEGCAQGEEELFRRYDLTASVFNRRSLPPDLKVEVEIDTGLTRLGISREEATGFIGGLAAQVTGVYSHFADPEEDPVFTRLQLKRFLQATAGLDYPRHISASAGLPFPEAHLDAVRIGLALYGVAPCPEVDYVEPVLSWKARLLTIREIPKNRSIGYGRSFVTHRKSRIGVLAVGYADGYNRLFSSRGQVRVRGHLAPIVGRVSMDLTSVDLTEIPPAQVGDEVILLEDKANSPISAAALAKTLGTISYEVLTRIGPRVDRFYTALDPPNPALRHRRSDPS